MNQNQALLSLLAQQQQRPPMPSAAVSGAFAVPQAQLQHMAGDVVPMQPNTNLSPSALYDRVLQPGGMQRLQQMPAVPQNVVPLPQSILRRAG